jgi:ABC-2 type transport system permease protein
VLIAMLSPSFQLTNAITQMAIFYVLFFAPVIFPREQLPAALQYLGDFLPASHAADAIRATMTDLPGTHLARSLLVLAGFAAGSLALASMAARRRA